MSKTELAQRTSITIKRKIQTSAINHLYHTKAATLLVLNQRNHSFACEGSFESFRLQRYFPVFDPDRMNKSLLGIFLCLLGAAVAFSPTLHHEPRVAVVSTTALHGWFDNKASSSKKAAVTKKETKKKSDDWIKNMFSPVHGGGSAKENDLDDIYADQQRILAERRKHFDSKTLHNKYKTVGQDHLRDIKTIAHDPKMLNQKEDDAMYIDQDHDKKTSSMFPWNKKLHP